MEKPVFKPDQNAVSVTRIADKQFEEMTDDEKIDYVAHRILSEHRAAFEELARFQ